MIRHLALLVTVALAAGCASVSGSAERGDIIRKIVASTVQLRSEREGVRRAASGVVIASDAASPRSWVLTTRHFLDARESQPVSIRRGAVRAVAKVAVIGIDVDLAILEVPGVALPGVTLKDVAQLGDEVWVVAFPWGRRLTVVSGVVSQLAGEDGEPVVAGAPRMIDASVSYGSSGGGVFDIVTGALIGIVEGYRTARMTTREERALEIPVAGETTIISSRAIRSFLGTTSVPGPPDD
ncbi:MAG: trypsin-like peptidase domain-containing protein [Candidatus Rokuibacteriota bacterium]